MKELHIRRAICAWIRLHRGVIFVHDSVGVFDPVRKIYRKNCDPYRLKGASDLLGIWRGRFLAIEVKRPGGKLTDDQVRFLAMINQAGGVAFKAESIRDVERELKERGLFE